MKVSNLIIYAVNFVFLVSRSPLRCATAAHTSTHAPTLLLCAGWYRSAVSSAPLPHALCPSRRPVCACSVFVFFGPLPCSLHAPPATPALQLSRGIVLHPSHPLPHVSTPLHLPHLLIFLVLLFLGLLFCLSHSSPSCSSQILGAAITGLAATHGYKHDHVLSEAYSRADVSLHVAMTVGVFLMVLALVGCAGARLREHSFGRFLLYIYLLLLVLLFILQIVAATYLLAAAGTFKQPKQIVNEVAKFTQEQYGYCCTSSPASANCVVNRINEDLTWCNEGTEEAFVDHVNSWIKTNLRPIGQVLMVMASVTFIVFIALCCAISRGRSAQKAKEAAASQQGYYRAADPEQGYAAPNRPTSGGAIRY